MLVEWIALRSNSEFDSKYVIHCTEICVLKDIMQDCFNIIN